MLLCITTVEKNRNMGRNVLEQFTERTKRAVMGGKKEQKSCTSKSDKLQSNPALASIVASS